MGYSIDIIDINSTWDSKVRSFRYKNVQSSQCTYCKSTQDIEHILLCCNHANMTSNRNTFFRKYSQYLYKFLEKGNTGKTREILNLNPSCAPNNTSKAKESICMYIKQLYWILENKVNTEH